MSSKRNIVNLEITYQSASNRREDLIPEMKMVVAINRLLDQHRYLMAHDDDVQPKIITDIAGTYEAKIQLRFITHCRDNKPFQHARLHFLLTELSKICDEYIPHFEQWHTHLDLSNMALPWVSVVGPAQVLLRKDAAQWNATGSYIPSHDTKFHTPINGMTVLGEPKAVEHFRRVWYREAHAKANTPIDIRYLMATHPSLQWKHIQVWVHAETPTGGDWYVINLDESDEWLKMGIQYMHTHLRTMIEEPMHFTEGHYGRRGTGSPLVFFKGMEFHTFEVTACVDEQPVSEFSPQFVEA